MDWGFFLSIAFPAGGFITQPHYICRCLLKVLCPVSRPITTLDCVLLKNSNRASVARFGPDINSWACLCVLQGQCHNARCCFSIQHQRNKTSYHKLLYQFSVKLKIIESKPRQNPPDQDCFTSFFLLVPYAL